MDEGLRRRTVSVIAGPTPVVDRMDDGPGTSDGDHTFEEPEHSARPGVFRSSSVAGEETAGHEVELKHDLGPSDSTTYDSRDEDVKVEEGTNEEHWEEVREAPESDKACWEGLDRQTLDGGHETEGVHVDEVERRVQGAGKDGDGPADSNESKEEEGKHEGEGVGQADDRVGTEGSGGVADKENHEEGESEGSICRICFGGNDEELGRLISPCLCKGTMRYVHVQCLDKWRKTSVGATSFFKCDQCKYEYRLKRTAAAGLAENKFILIGVTILLFSTLVIVSGFVASYILDLVEPSSLSISEENAYYAWDYKPMILYNTGVGQTVGDAVRVFGKAAEEFAEVVKVAKEKGGPGIREAGGGEEDLDEYRGGRVAEERFNELRRIVGGTKDVVNDGGKGAGQEDEASVYRYVSPKARSRSAAFKKTVPHSRRRRRRRRRESNPYIVYLSWLPNIFLRLINHILLGLSLIGILSFLSFLISLSLLGPLHHLRLLRRTATNRGGGGELVGTIVIVTFVVIGLAKAIWGTWKLVRKLARWVMRRVEHIVLEV